MEIFQAAINIPAVNLKAIKEQLLQMFHVDLPDWMDTDPCEEDVRDTLITIYDCMAILDAAHDKIR